MEKRDGRYGPFHGVKFSILKVQIIFFESKITTLVLWVKRGTIAA